MKSKGLCAALVPAAALAAGVLLPLFVPSPAMKKISGHGGDWMSVLSDDVPLSALAIPGTHDSGTKNAPFALIAKCQNLSIPSQLEAGCRFLDIRLRLKKGRFILAHGVVPCLAEHGLYDFDRFMGELNDFLRMNPTETVLVSIKRDAGESEGFVRLLYEKYLSNGRWFLENRMPTLGEVRGKAVLLRRFEQDDYPLTDENGGLNFSPALWGNSAGRQAHGYRKFRMERLDGTDGGEVCLQDCYSLAPYAKWYGAFCPLLDRGRAEGETVLNFLSCTGLLSPAAAAVSLNRRFSQSDTPLLADGGIVVFDFLDASIAEKVYTANAARRDAAKTYPAHRRPCAPQPEYLLSRWMNGYANLVYHAAKRVSAE